MPVVKQNGDFLDEEKKKVKGDLMCALIDAYFDTMQEKGVYTWQPQEIMDLVCSILVMFNRDIIVHTLTAFTLQDERKAFMKNLFSVIQEQVNQKIRNTMV